jgi:hypothetical protein
MHLIEELLEAGCTVRVGAHATNTDRLIVRANGATTWRDTSREMRPGRFPDICLEVPRLNVELKVFGEVGAKDYPDKPGCVTDLRKISDGSADAAIVIASAACYDALQQSTGKYNFPRTYPLRSRIGGQFHDFDDLWWEEHRLIARAAKTRIALAGNAAMERVVVCLRKAPAKAVTAN